MRVLTKRTVATIAAIGLTLGLAGGPVALFGADHLDAPGLTPPGGDTRLDINDVYAFQSPSNSNNAVLIMTTNPAAGAITGQLGFRPGATYEFLVDVNGDAKPDNWARFKFGSLSNGEQSWSLKFKGGGTFQLNGVTGQTTEAGPVKVSAGTFDDPFFFDLNNFLAADFTCTPGDGDTSNFFRTLNTQAIVLEFPRAELGSGTMGVWARTRLGDAQIDRMGRPAINTVFIPNNIFEPAGTEPSQRNAFNAGKPHNDRRDFRGEVVDTLEIFYGAGSQGAQNLANVLLPDVLTVNFGSTAGFLNGRQLANDVIDAELGLVTDGAVTTDCVGNDSTFSNQHPYLAPAQD